MIIVKVEVPILGESYDFQIDENSYVVQLIEDFTEMVCRRNACGFSGDAGRMLLWDKARGLLLRRDQTAAENGVVNGSVLMLA